MLEPQGETPCHLCFYYLVINLSLMSEFVVDIDPDNWSKALDVLDFYFVEDQDMMDALGIESRQTLYDHRKGEREFMDSFVAENILAVLNDSGPAVSLEGSADDYVLETYNAWGERAEVREDVAEFVFGAYTNAELAEKAEVDRRRAVDYKNGENNPAVGLFEECFSEVSEAFEATFRPEISVYPNGAYSSPVYSDEGEGLFEAINREELSDINSAVRDMNRLEENFPAGYTGIERRPEAIEEMKEVAGDPLRSELSRQNITSSPPFFQGITETDMAEKLGGKKSRYLVNVSETYLDTVSYLIK